MRIYIIGNDGITLCREPPPTIDKGEIAVASREELHAARLSGKRLLALWNALPGVEKQTKVGDRDTLIGQLWSAIEALPDPEQPSDTKRPSKQEAVIAMLQRPEGATVDEVASVMGWQRHTVRGLFSGTLKKKLGLTLASATEIIHQLLPHEFRRALDEFGAVRYDFPRHNKFPLERFTLSVTGAGDEVWAEIRRRRIPDDDFVPEEFFEPQEPRPERPAGFVSTIICTGAGAI